MSKPGWKEQASAQGVMPMDAKLITPAFERKLKAMDAEGDARRRRALVLVRYHQPVMALREVRGADGSPAKAQALLDLGRLAQGGDAARQATAQHPGSAFAWLALARWELESGNYAEALDAVKRSAKVCTRTPEAEEGTAKTRPAEARKTMNSIAWMASIRTALGRFWQTALPPLVLAGVFLLAASGVCQAAEASPGATPVGRSKSGPQLVGEQDSLLSAGGTLSVSFADAMVPASAIEVEAQKSPIVFVPELRGQFMWMSQTEGVFTCASVPPGTTFQVLLAPRLVDLAGRPVKTAKPGEPLGIRKSGEFTVSSYFSQNPIDRRPSVELTFSVKIKPADLAGIAWFQDRDSRERFPAEVIVQPDEREKEITSATVTPRADLPAGRTFDLIVDGLKDAATGTALKRPFVKVLGETEALKVIKVAAFNYPLRKPRITVQFSEPVLPEQGKRIQIEPPVEVKTVARGDELWLEGAFDLHQRYRVTVPGEITGKRGFALAGPSVWGASFQAKKPSLIFTTEDLHQRSRLGLRFGFIQVNTGPLEWRFGASATGEVAGDQRALAGIHRNTGRSGHGL